MYRLAGPGFGAWRELAANLILTEGVLAGEAESFPLLYHWRVLPGRPPVAPEHHDVDAIVAQFGGATSVSIRFEELAGAAFSLVLFLEYIPRPLPDWLDDPAGRAETFERQLLRPNRESVAVRECSGRPVVNDISSTYRVRSRR